jgi:hypothetical protein
MPLREGGGSSPHYDGYEQLEPRQLSWTADRLQDRHGGVTVPVINCPVPLSPPDRHDRLRHDEHPAKWPGGGNAMEQAVDSRSATERAQRSLHSGLGFLQLFLVRRKIA